MSCNLWRNLIIREEDKSLLQVNDKVSNFCQALEASVDLGCRLFLLLTPLFLYMHTFTLEEETYKAVRHFS